MIMRCEVREVNFVISIYQNIDRSIDIVWRYFRNNVNTIDDVFDTDKNDIFLLFLPDPTGRTFTRNFEITRHKHKKSAVRKRTSNAYNISDTSIICRGHTNVCRPMSVRVSGENDGDGLTIALIYTHFKLYVHGKSYKCTRIPTSKYNISLIYFIVGKNNKLSGTRRKNNVTPNPSGICFITYTHTLCAVHIIQVANRFCVYVHTIKST